MYECLLYRNLIVINISHPLMVVADFTSIKISINNFFIYNDIFKLIFMNGYIFFYYLILKLVK